MTAEKRRAYILDRLCNSDVQVSATMLANELGVSRQIVVGDVALLRAAGQSITATARGYVMQSNESYYTVACRHTKESLEEELYIIIDCGCGVIDIRIDHELYGELTGNLHLFSRRDIAQFLEKMKANNVVPLSALTNNVHLHTVSCPTKSHYEELVKALGEKGYLADDKN